MKPPLVGPGFRLIAEFGRVGSSSREAIWASAEVHVKFDDRNLPGTLWRELVASRLASAIGLPVPPGGLAESSDGRQVWVTARTTIRGEEPPPGDPAVIVRHNPHVAAGIAVFDNWIANLDRHAGNLIFAKSIGTWLIDHEQAFGARQPEDLAAVDGGADDYHVFRGLPIPRASLNDWVARVRSIPSMAIEHAVNDAYVHRLLSATGRDAVESWLLDRRQRVESIVKMFEKQSIRSTVVPNSDDGEGGALW